MRYSNFIYKTSRISRAAKGSCKVMGVVGYKEEYKPNKKELDVLESNKKIDSILSFDNEKEAAFKISKIVQAFYEKLNINHQENFERFEKLLNKCNLKEQELQIEGYKYFLVTDILNNGCCKYRFSEFDVIFDRIDCELDKKTSKRLQGFDLNNEKIQGFLSEVKNCLSLNRERYYKECENKNSYKI